MSLESARSHVCDWAGMYSGQLRFGIWTPSANRLGKWHGPARPMGLMSWQSPHNVLTMLALAPSPLTLPEHWRADRKHHRNQTNSEIHKRTDRVTRDFWMDMHVNKQKCILFSPTHQTHAYTQACTKHSYGHLKERERCWHLIWGGYLITELLWMKPIPSRMCECTCHWACHRNYT